MDFKEKSSRIIGKRGATLTFSALGKKTEKSDFHIFHNLLKTEINKFYEISLNFLKFGELQEKYSLSTFPRFGWKGAEGDRGHIPSGGTRIHPAAPLRRRRPGRRRPPLFSHTAQRIPESSRG